MAKPTTVLSFNDARKSFVSAFGGLRGLIETATLLAERSVDCVLAIVVDSSAAAERKQGAMSVFSDRGHQAGSLGGGALEQALSLATQSVLTDGRAKLVHFDAVQDADDASIGAKDTSSFLQLLVLPMPANSSPLRMAISGACESSAWLRLRLELGARGQSQPEPGYGEARTGSELFAFDNRGAAVAGSRAFLRHASLSIAPPPRLALLGCGAESMALVRQAHLLGWYAEIVDARADALARADESRVDRLHANAPRSLPDLLSERHFDAAVIGSQDFALDLAHLRELGNSGIGYIGLIGPPERREALLAKVGDIAATQLEPRLYAPAGLRLGGEGPEVTALAVIAQLQYYLTHDAHA